MLAFLALLVMVSILPQDIVAPSIPILCNSVIIGIKLEYLCCNKLPRIIFVLMCEHDYIISRVVNGARSLVLIDEKVL